MTDKHTAVGRRVAITTLGCKLNYAESSALREQFVRDGYTVVPFGSETDVVVVNTCTVTERADAECRQIVRRSLRVSPHARIAITGCYAQLQPEQLASIDGVHLVVGQSHKQRIPDLLAAVDADAAPYVHVDEFTDDEPFTSARSSDTDSRTRAFLKIQDGCDYACTFCTIPLARGPGRSQDLDEILVNFDALVSEGYQEVVLTGVNVGEYRSSRGERFLDVVQAIDAHCPPLRVRISSIEPNTLKPDVIRAIAKSPVFCDHVHVPLQHGTAELLQRMKRRYHPDMYRGTIELVRSEMPDAAIGIDVIVGFPGETDALFEESLAFISSLPFTYLHVFTYSERQNTPAASFGERVPHHVRQQRTMRLRMLSDARRRAFAATQQGRQHIVIPEAFDAERNAYPALTSNYVRVAIDPTTSLLHIPYKATLGALDGDVVRAVIDGPVHANATSLPPFHIPIALR